MKKTEREQIMKIHNITEDEVVKSVNNLYEQVKKMKLPWLKCDCPQCRLDTICYVLNRITPKYIVSGRGVNHVLSSKNVQSTVDMETIVVEGMKIVNSVSRPYHNGTVKNNDTKIEGEVYNFPTFIGAVYDGITFEPLECATVTLMADGKKCDMIDFTWQNPCMTRLNTNGSYTFLVASEKAEDDSKSYNFTIEVSAEGYETVTHNFTVTVNKENYIQDSVNSTYSLHIPDLFLFPLEDA